MTVVAIHVDPNAPTPYPDRWAQYLKQAGVEVRRVNLRLPDGLNQIRDCSGVMWHWEFMPHERQVAYRILHAIETYLKIPVFPDHRTAWFYDDKIAQTYIFQALGIPMPRTWIFWDYEPARQWARITTYPKVFKLATGASSSAVRLVASADEALALIDLMFGPGVYPDEFLKVSSSYRFPRNLQQWREFLRRWKAVLRWAIKDRLPDLPPRYWWSVEKNYIYFQDFIPDNVFDTRVTVIGHRAFAFRRFNRPGDFRASGSGRIDWDISQINLECVRLAHEISAKLGCQSMAYDFLIDQSGSPVVTEISYTYLDWPVERCEGYWDRDLRWVEGHVWPEAAQVEDFLARITSR